MSLDHHALFSHLYYYPFVTGTNNFPVPMRSWYFGGLAIIQAKFKA